MADKPKISIEYCPRCGWLLRAAWLAQELLTTFDQELAAVELVPASRSGRFVISLDGAQIWCRQADAGFPHAAELKRRVRDRIAPERSLGHSDTQHAREPKSSTE